MPIRDDIKFQVQQATRLEELIGEQILLKHKGREYVGLCPFHEDKNPSMYVSPAKQIFHCFVCNAGGDAFGWMMKYHKMTFPEAIKFLAERAGIELPRWDGPGAKGQGNDSGPSDRQLITEANGLAVMFFQSLLRHPLQGQLARAYLDKRQITAPLLEAFQVGYAPDGWDGLGKAIAKNKWNQRAFEAAGLITARDKGQRDEGRGMREEGRGQRDNSSGPSSLSPSPSSLSSFYDRLRHRIIFPICDSLGRPIAFGGRKIRDEDEPKYLNSPEHALFSKSRTLYGLHLAKKAMLAERVALIVEGYVDVIACHAMGTTNAVATLGTALTADHVKELRKYCDKVVLVFDADAAGQKAADRALEIFLGEEMDVAIAVVPEGKDPGDLMLLEEGSAKWKAAIAAATDALDYQFARVKEQLDASTTTTARQRIAEDYLRRLATLGMEQSGAIRKAMIVQRVAGLLHMTEETVHGLLKKFAPVRKLVAGAPSRKGGAPPAVAGAPPYRDGALQPSVAPPYRDGAPQPSVAPPYRDGASVPAFASHNSPDDAHGGSPALPAPPFANIDQSDSTQNLPLSDVASLTDSAKIRLAGAERQLMGCLLRQPDLFHTTLSDGRMLDEAITPCDFFTPQGRELFQWVYDLLADGKELSLRRLLADFAQDGLDRLAALATQIEADMEAMMQTGPCDLKAKAIAAADCIVQHHRSTEYRSSRPVVLQNEAPETELRKLIEFNRANPSPTKILRIDA